MSRMDRVLAVVVALGIVIGTLAFVVRGLDTFARALDQPLAAADR